MATESREYCGSSDSMNSPTSLPARDVQESAIQLANGFGSPSGPVIHQLDLKKSARSPSVVGSQHVAMLVRVSVSSSFSNPFAKRSCPYLMKLSTSSA